MTTVPPGRRRPTMADIARRAGVHPSTVSLALRNQPSIPAATREKIRRIAAGLNYRPDPLLAAFNSRRVSRAHPGRRWVIAFLSDQPDRTALAESERHREILAGAEEEAGRLGLCVDVLFTGPGRISPARLRQVVRARGIAGVIIGALGPGTRRLPLDCDDLCAVAVESMHLKLRLDTVATNYREAARLAVRKLRELGHRRIVFALDPGLPQIARQELRAGYLVEHFIRLRAGPSPFWIVDSGWTGAVPAWVRRRRPDALVCCGLAPPRAGIAGTVAVIDAPAMNPGPPGVPAAYRALGRRAVEMLAIRLKANLTGLPAHASTTYLPVAWRD